MRDEVFRRTEIANADRCFEEIRCGVSAFNLVTMETHGI